MVCCYATTFACEHCVSRGIGFVLEGCIRRTDKGGERTCAQELDYMGHFMHEQALVPRLVAKVNIRAAGESASSESRSCHRSLAPRVQPHERKILPETALQPLPNARFQWSHKDPNSIRNRARARPDFSDPQDPVLLRAGRDGRR